MRRSYAFFIITGILLFASLPRGIELLNHNYLFGFDQGHFFEAVKDIVVNHKLTLIGTEVGGQGGFFQGPGWYYLLAIPFALSGGNPYAAMVFMFILSLCVILFSYLFSAKMFDKKTGIVVSFLLAICPALIAQSRFIWPPFVISILSVILLFFLYKVFEKKEKYLPLAAFIIGLMSHFEIATAGTMLAQLVLIIVVLHWKKIISLKSILFSFGSFLLTLLPLIIFDLRHNFLMVHGIVNLFSQQVNTIHQAAKLGIGAVFQNHLAVFRANFISSFQEGNLLLPLLLIVLVVGSISYMRDKKEVLSKKIMVFYLATTPIMLFGVFMFYRLPLWEWWLLELVIFYNWLLGVLLVYFWKRSYVLRSFVVIALLIFGIFYVNQTKTFYEKDYNDFGGVHKVKGKLEAIDYIYKDADNTPFNVLVFTPPVYTYAYDYLLWWHGQKTYGYVPGKEKRGVFYLLMEPDPQKEWSYKGWLETIVKTGKITKTVQLPSGFIIQKRTGEDMHEN